MGYPLALLEVLPSLPRAILSGSPTIKVPPSKPLLSALDQPFFLSSYVSSLSSILYNPWDSCNLSCKLPCPRPTRTSHLYCLSRRYPSRPRLLLCGSQS
ncbi:hypothetical protein F4861DRAFT_363019 [Xylaria intraflava]|nr:hypothetical protein F4861DRAFT_363019 [Xylaria intraflava]